MASYLVGFWNLENLFAPEGFQDREPWIARRMANDLAGWTEAFFERKVQQLATVINRMADGAGPDILGVCEVENRFVLDRLVGVLNGQLSNRNYDVVHADSKRDHRAIDTAFIYDKAKFSIDEDAIFSHFVMRRTGTRDILQATFTSQTGNELIALSNHWPSRSGGAAESAGFRATAGETLGYWHERIREEKGEDIAVIALGDFNDDPFDPSLRHNARAWRERGDVERARTAKFYNLAWRYLTQSVLDHRGNQRVLDGTLYYRGDGNLFDQILVNPALLKPESVFRVVEETARIEAFPEMTDHRVGSGPIRFGLPKGDAANNVNLDGFSDHFPVSVLVEETATS
ncbi:MAG: endonuclease/exonuclease/phosphatase family protein [Geminicoccaceae bacterium]